MIRSEIRTKFREENPEVTEKVASDATLNSWMFTADKEISALTRCIVSNESEIIDSIVEAQFYDLSTISKFYDIDDFPGGGVYYNDEPVTKGNPSELNRIRRNWKSDSSSDTISKWWRRGKYIWFDKKTKTADLEIAIDCVYISSDFNGDSDMPFNNLNHLIPFHDSISKYLQWRIKQKLNKQDEAKIAKADYLSYVKWMKSEVSGYSKSAIRMRISSAYRGTQC